MSNDASCTLRVEMPREKAWEILRDFSLAHNYVPGLVKSEINTEQTAGVGASRKVYQSETRGIDETIIEWNEGYGFLIRLHKGDQGAPPPFTEGHFRYAIEDDGDATKLTNSLIYTLRWGALGAFLDRLFLNRIMTGVIRDVTLSMKQYYETGQGASKADLKRLRAQWKGR